MNTKSSSITILKSTLFRGGGLEKYTRRIIQAFLDKNWKVTVLTTGKIPSDNEMQKGSPNLQIVTHKYLSPCSFLKVLEFDRFCRKYLENHPTDVVFGLDRNSFQTHIRAGNGVHASYLEKRKKSDSFLKRLSYRINPLHQILLHMEKRAFTHPLLQKIFTNSSMVKEEIIQFFQVDPSKIEVVHNAVEWSELQTPFTNWQEGKNLLAKQLQINPSLYQFIFIGHNYQRKGLDRFLEALAGLPRQNYHLTVVGKDKNIQKYKQYTENLGIKNQVTFVGEAKSLPFYQLADCIVIPSYYDPFANVTVEALAMGVYVVSSKTNGGHEILSETGGVVIDSLENLESIRLALETAMKYPKTTESALKIRNSVKDRDFSSQITFFTDACAL
ncbi:MAG: glycosyltransferase family 4 protein [Chlamydiae bacterium]|nr:glycosyltransferase family 4 protein [Chlamydiota bacterium]